MLKLLKEYIDAKADYDNVIGRFRSSAVAPSVSLTETGRRIEQRYLAAEKALNEAIDREDATTD